MKKYIIEIVGTIERVTEIEVKAETREKAQKEAQRQIDNREIIICNDIEDFDSIEAKILTVIENK